jgi:hypothetical protein
VREGGLGQALEEEGAWEWGCRPARIGAAKREFNFSFSFFFKNHICIVKIPKTPIKSWKF